MFLPFDNVTATLTEEVESAREPLLPSISLFVLIAMLLVSVLIQVANDCYLHLYMF